MTLLDLFGTLALITACIAGGSYMLWMLIRRAIQRRQQGQPRQAIYEVGSPEYNAQIVSVIRTLNTQLADQGKRIPEKTAIQIIQQITGTEPERNNE